MTVLDNLERGHRAAIPDGARLVEADLLDAAAVERALGDGYRRRRCTSPRSRSSAESVADPELY